EGGAGPAHALRHDAGVSGVLQPEGSQGSADAARVLRAERGEYGEDPRARRAAARRGARQGERDGFVVTDEIRLQRYLAQAGIASRRKAEALITGGRVRVNGRAVTELGTKVRPERDRVDVDGVRVKPQRVVYLVLNKPH